MVTILLIVMALLAGAMHVTPRNRRWAYAWPVRSNSSNPPTTPVELPPNPVTPEAPAYPIESPPSEDPVPVREPPNVKPPVAASRQSSDQR